MNVFCGEYNINLDDKGRIALPSKIRPRNEDGSAMELILTRGLEGCLALHTPVSWKQALTVLAEENYASQDLRILRRYLFGKMAEVTPDKQGRFLIPNNLITFAGLSDKVLVVGVDNSIEIWNPETYENSMSESGQAGDMEEIVERIYNRSIGVTPNKSPNTSTSNNEAAD